MRGKKKIYFVSCLRIQSAVKGKARLQEREAAAFSQEAEMNAGVQLLCSLLILGA